MKNIIINTTITTVDPVSFTHHSIDGQPLMTRGISASGEHQKSVFIPASAFRGRIRHETAFNELPKRGKVKLSVAYMAALGQSTEGNVEENNDAKYKIGEAMKLRQSDPIVDLFGSWKINSRLMVSHFLPAVNVQPESFSIIRKDIDSNAELFGLLDDDQQEEFYSRQDTLADASKIGDQIKVAKKAIVAAKKAKDENLMKELDAKIRELEDQKKDAKISAGGDGNNSKHLLQVEAIPGGIDLFGTLIVRDALPRDLDMLLAAFDRISQKPLVGGHTARGFGQVAIEAQITAEDGEVLAVVKMGGWKKAVVQWTKAGSEFAGMKQAA